MVAKSTADLAHDYFASIVDVNGNVASTPVRVVLTATGGRSFKNITTSTTTLVKTGAATLHTVCVNTKGTVASTVKVYDGVDASGVLVATIDSLNLTGTFTYDIACVTGICIVTTGTVAPDVTVTYV